MWTLGLKLASSKMLHFRCGCAYHEERDRQEPTLAGVTEWRPCAQHDSAELAADLGLCSNRRAA